jgi:16S rRNA processing protein RimM
MPERFPFPVDRYILVGSVSKAHGLKGEMKVNPLPSQAEHLLQSSRAALVAADGRMTAPLELVRTRLQGRQIILKLDTIDTKNEVDITVGMGVLIPREEVEESEDTPLLPLLVGRQVRDAGQGRVIGSVEDFFNNGAQDILVVRDVEAEYLIPVIDTIIVEIA